MSITASSRRPAVRRLVFFALVLCAAAGAPYPFPAAGAQDTAATSSAHGAGAYSPATGAGAQDFFSATGELVTVRAAASLSIFHPGSSGFLAVTADIAEGWHINSHTPRDEYLIPTTLNVTAPAGITIERILYPAPDLRRLAISEERMSLYHGTVTFGAVLAVERSAQPGPYTLTATLGYQGCNDMTCVAPADATVELTLTVGGLDRTTEAIHEDIFSKPPFTASGAPPGGAPGAGEPPRAGGEKPGVERPAGTADMEGAPETTAPPAETDAVGGIIEERGLFLAFIAIFFAGLALNLTPCIYPIIPITVSYFGGQSGGKTSRTFLLALLYVLGMSITYSILGVIAAMTGSLFGAALQNPWVILFIAVVLVGLATSMFGLWEIRMPMFLTRRTGSARRGYVGAVFMGLTVGVLAAPCIGPFVLGLLTYVGNLGKPVMGFLMFFTLAWGMGLPFLVLGTVSGSISHLPQAGNWMIWVRKVFGFVLIAMAIYFTRPLIGALPAAVGYVVVALVAGVYLGWIERTAVEKRWFMSIRRIVGVACIAVAALIVALPGGPIRHRDASGGIDWKPYSTEALAAAAEAGTPVMIDFTADWCIPCHELDHQTFSDPGVAELARRFVPLKVDMTRIGERERRLKQQYRIQGVPTIVFIDGTGVERERLRVSGFLGPRAFGKILERASEHER